MFLLLEASSWAEYSKQNCIDDHSFLAKSLSAKNTYKYSTFKDAAFCALDVLSELRSKITTKGLNSKICHKRQLLERKGKQCENSRKDWEKNEAFENLLPNLSPQDPPTIHNGKPPNFLGSQQHKPNKL